MGSSRRVFEERLLTFGTIWSEITPKASVTKAAKRASVPRIVSVESDRPGIVSVEAASRPRIIGVTDKKKEE